MRSHRGASVLVCDGDRERGRVQLHLGNKTAWPQEERARSRAPRRIGTEQSPPAHGHRAEPPGAWALSRAPRRMGTEQSPPAHGHRAEPPGAWALPAPFADQKLRLLSSDTRALSQQVQLLRVEPSQCVRLWLSSVSAARPLGYGPFQITPPLQPSCRFVLTLTHARFSPSVVQCVLM